MTVWPLRASNSQSANRSVTFLHVRSIRRSGLSEPYVSMAVLYGMRRKGAAEATLYVPNLAKMGGSTSSSTAKTSSWVAKAISISSW